MRFTSPMRYSHGIVTAFEQGTANYIIDVGDHVDYTVQGHHKLRAAQSPWTPARATTSRSTARPKPAKRWPDGACPRNPFPYGKGVA
ncbi:hypothetical protein AWB80_05548 [Caballeronia pedi]|uniref:Uncharacterized protein n=2 Tax=Caballeronia pedi TaxID=1777141 RepID=A0A158CN65_9BURK|nr:hypothetical protein AWB80_05548 [Caballeronia pedi]